MQNVLKHIIELKTNLLKENTFDILLIADGSGTIATRCSAWTCIKYESLNNKVDIYYGGGSLGTNNFAELMPFVNVFWLLLQQKQEPCKILIISDSELTVKCGNREYSRNCNLILWESINYLETLGYTIKWKHVPRNSNPLNKLCDTIAGRLRKEIEKFDLTTDKEVGII